MPSVVCFYAEPSSKNKIVLGFIISGRDLCVAYREKENYNMEARLTVCK